VSFKNDNLAVSVYSWDYMWNSLIYYQRICNRILYMCMY